MHMSPISYDDFTFFGDIVYELSNKMLLEKVNYLYIYIIIYNIKKINKIYRLFICQFVISQ